jgi:hypothetical protein
MLSKLAGFVVLILLLVWAAFCPSVEAERMGVIDIVLAHVELFKGLI